MFLGKCVKIDWIDPNTIGGKWTPLNEVEKSKPVNVVTYGLVVFEDSEIIVTVAHKTSENDVDGDITLPKSIIKNITELNEGTIHSFSHTPITGISTKFTSESVERNQNL